MIETPPRIPTVPFLRPTEEQASKVLRQLQSIYGELDLVQDLLHVCSGACNAEIVDMDVRDVAHVLRRCGSDRLFSAQKALTKIIERFGGRTEMSEPTE